MSADSEQPQQPESFSTYVEELQDLSGRRGLRFGSPSDMGAFSLQISESSGFRAEVGSMIRSFIYRENLKISSSALLDLLSLAWGGSDFSGVRALAQSDGDELVQFVEASMRPSRLEEDPVNAVSNDPSESSDIGGKVANPPSDFLQKRSSDRMSRAMGLTIEFVGLDGGMGESVILLQPVRTNPWTSGSVLHLALREFAEKDLLKAQIDGVGWKPVLSAFLDAP